MTKKNIKKSEVKEQKKSEIKETKKNDLPDDLVSKLKFMEKLGELKEQFSKHQKALRDLKHEMLSLEHSYHNDIVKVYKAKKHRNNTKKHGCIDEILLPDSVAAIFNVETGSKMSKPEISKRLYNELRNRNLVYEKDKRVLRVDKDISKAFNIPESVNESFDYTDKNGFNIITLPKYLAKLNKDKEIEPVEIEPEQKEKEIDEVKIKIKSKSPLIKPIKIANI